MMHTRTVGDMARIVWATLAFVALAATAAGDGADPSGSGGVEPATHPATSGPAEPVVRMTRPGTFDISFAQDTDIQKALRLMATYGRKNIVTTKEVTGTITADLYGVTFKEALEAVLRFGGYVYQEKGSFIYVMTPKQLEEITKSDQKLSVRAFRLSYVTALDAKTLVTPALSTEGTVAITPPAAVGIATSATDAGGNSHANDDVLVVKDYEENLTKVEGILRDVDIKPEQVLIEATILRASLGENNELGIDFDCLGGVDFNKISSTSTGFTNLTPGAVTKMPSDTVSAVNTNFAGAVDTGGLSVGIVSNDRAMFIRALEGITDVTLLANPKLLVVNKQRGEVMVGEKDGYLTTTLTETTATQTVQFLDSGTNLVVRPFIGKEGFIRLEIHPEQSTGSVGLVGTSVLPKQTTTEVTSNVMVRDGHTIVIGGLFRESTSSSRNQIPVVGNIPYLGTLFRNTIDATVRDEMIILITPRIIRYETDDAVGDQLKDDVERFRVGQRKGLRWWGRERLAQIHIRQAKQDLVDCKRDCALWNIDMALSLEPRMEEAIRLKERLTEKAYWADEAQYSAAKYIVERLVMTELGKPVERVIPPNKPRTAEGLPKDVRNAFDAQPRIEDPLPGDACPMKPKAGCEATDEPKGSTDTPKPSEGR